VGVGGSSSKRGGEAVSKDQEEKKKEEEDDNEKKEEEGEEGEDGWKEDAQDWKSVCRNIIHSTFETTWEEIYKREKDKREKDEKQGKDVSSAEKKKKNENLNSFLGSKAQGTVKPNFLADIIVSGGE
jgi:hypothetical protein